MIVRRFRCWALALLVLGCGAAERREVTALRFAPMTAGDATLPTIRVEVSQFTWEIHYPNGLVRFSEIVLPIGRPMAITVHSNDLEHRLVLDDSSLQIEVPPHGTVTRRVDGLAAASLRSRCTINCPDRPEDFTTSVRVVTAAEYDAWIASFDAPPSDRTIASLGHDLFRESGCAICHGGSGGVLGSTLTDLVGQTVRDHEGNEHVLDEAGFDSFVRAWILRPSEVAPPGVSMPASPDLRPAQVDALVAYVHCREAHCAEHAECAGAGEPPAPRSAPSNCGWILTRRPMSVRQCSSRA